ncbi:heparinase II/III family protein [Candidatus Pelagibacter communis]|uniref:heparinase II/III family protein n=1 Tax=Pelagibacter ubique TaxID=198252 RepID=UPI00094C54F1|nr:heparinase II/III-family protein [Candidatus Pelagibacter ubique]
MILRNSLNFIPQFLEKIKKQFRRIYLNSNLYDKKISKVDINDIVYKPSPHLLSSLIKYQTKKININDIVTENIWEKQNDNIKDFKRLNNFYWFFSLDLKSSKKNTRKIVSDWIRKNFRYNSKSWEFDLTSKRIIAWLSNHSLTIEESDKQYLNQLTITIKKQTNHLINEIKNSKLIDDKIIGCAAIILVGLCYKDKKNYLPFGLQLLKKISKLSFDNLGFPKSRNIKQLVSYLKYYILIREWFKEAQVEIPEQVNETIYYLGQGYAFLWQNIKSDILMNGNNISNNFEFDQYLKRFGYNFKNENKELGGYAVLHNNKTSIIMDIGPSPSSKFSAKYQSGALSFEINVNGKKLISNCGYYESKNNKLIELSKSTATHSTLVIDNNSSCYHKKNKKNFYINRGLKILKKEIIFEKNYWKINASHDGYHKKFNTIHEREIEFYPNEFKFIGTDKILIKKINLNIKFDIRFHLEPNVKLMKTQNNKAILIELDDEGWKFTCNKFDINIDNGLYFGIENSYTQNQNIFISGITSNQNENIIWQLSKI